MNKFSNIPQVSSMAHDLNDAYNAVEMAGGWEWLKDPETPGNGGFTWCEHPMLNKIHGFMEVLHSGGSMANVMRHMECIAKNGWDGYLKVLNGYK